MSLIDVTYFERGILAIPNTSAVHVSEAVQDAINLFENELLENVFGYELAALLTSLTPEPRFDEILNGCTFTYNDKKYKMVGLKSIYSPISYYVMYNYLNDNKSLLTGIGEVLMSSENSTKINPVSRMVKCWNRMSDEVNVIVKYLKENSDIFPEWIDNDVDYNLLHQTNEFGL